MKIPATERLSAFHSEECLPFFPYGVQYHRAPTPLPEEWETDLREIARAGYTHIQLRPQWRWHERVKGQPTWSDLDRLFDLAQQNALRVVLKPMLETAPDWIFSDYDGSRVGFHGVPLSPIAHGAYYVGGWWPCFDNPEVRNAASDFVANLVVRYREHPALWFYDAWNEPVSRPLGQCQCRHSVASYRQWLIERFGSIEALNEWAGKAWTSIETLEPPSSGADYLEMFLWRQWAGHSVASQVQFVSQTIRRHHDDAFILAHAGSPSITQDPVCLTSDDLLNRKMVDRYGTSFGIPHHPKSLLEHTAPDFQSDWLRRVDESYWCHEFYPKRDNWCVPPEPKTLARLIWMAIAGGPAGFTFWQYRSERVGCETNGYGIREIDGSANAGSEEIEKIALVLKQYGAFLVGARRTWSPIGILHSRESDMLARIQALPTSPYSIANEMPSDAYYYKQSIKSAHALHLSLGNTVEWVVPGDDLAKFSFLHLTSCEFVDHSMASQLEDFVKNGGTLLVEFPFACRDENTWLSINRPAHELQNLLGCCEGARTVIPESAELMFGEHCVAVKGWKITLKPLDDTEVFARWEDGSPAATRKSFGRGRVICLGCNLSLSFSKDWDDPIRETFRAMLRECQALQNPDLPDGLWLRKRVGPAGEVHFLFNVSESARGIKAPENTASMASSGAVITPSEITLEPGGFWVGAISPVSPPAVRRLARQESPTRLTLEPFPSSA